MLEQQRCEADLSAKLVAACDLADLPVEELVQRALLQPLTRSDRGWS
jgi:hypothetical protein